MVYLAGKLLPWLGSGRGRNGSLSCSVASTESGRYCGYCTDDSGALQSFEERFARMAAWQARRDPAASSQDIERQVLDYMATLPAWRDHPRVQAR
jgi:hypothetical protein